MPAMIDTTGGEVTFTIEVVGDASVGTHLLGGSYALETNSPFVTAMQWTNPSWSAFPTDGGYQGNGNCGQVIFGQLVIVGVPPFDVAAPGSELGGSLGSFQITIAQNIPYLYLQLDLVAQSPFTLEVIDAVTGETFKSSDGNLILNGATYNTIPAPASCVLLGLGGLATTRRRR